MGDIEFVICENRHLLWGRAFKKLMFRKPTDVIATTEVKAKRHETTTAAEVMLFQQQKSGRSMSPPSQVPRPSCDEGRENEGHIACE